MYTGRPTLFSNLTYTARKQELRSRCPVYKCIVYIRQLFFNRIKSVVRARFEIFPIFPIRSNCCYSPLYIIIVIDYLTTRVSHSGRLLNNCL